MIRRFHSRLPAIDVNFAEGIRLTAQEAKTSRCELHFIMT
jgi:hypothetical protein